MNDSTPKKTRKNNSTSHRTKARAYPAQQFDPDVNPGNRNFDGYRPQWMIEAEKKHVIGPVDFMVMRQYMNHMSREQCAAYLRVDPSSIRRWENGSVPIPFMAYELLRILEDNRAFRFSNPEWNGWRMTRNGELCSPDMLLVFSRADLHMYRHRLTRIAYLESRERELTAALAEAQGENTRLREMFVSQGIVDEIAAMQDRLGDLLTKINTAKLLPFQTSNPAQEKTACA